MTSKVSKRDFGTSGSKIDKKTAKKTVAAHKSILTNKQTGVFKIVYEGEDLTPEPLNLSIFDNPREKQLSVYEMGREGSQSESNTKIFQSQSASRFHTELHRQTMEAESGLRQSVISTSYGDEVVIGPEKKESTMCSLLEEDGDHAPEAAPRKDGVSFQIPKHLTLVLTETPTMFLFELASKTVEKNTEEANEVESENARYEYLTHGKGRNRKMVTIEVQTAPILLKSRCTEAERVKRRHNNSFASIWEMYDTYKKQAKTATTVFKQFIDDDMYVSESMQSLDSWLTTEEKQMIKLMKNENFLEAVCIVERLLANNNYNEQQKRFRGLSDPSPFRENIEYNYRLDLLWTFGNKETDGRCVTAMCWNEANPDILAVGYGKFYYTERATGMIMLWNVKNPVQPERTYRFENPVTAINFSKSNPNLLGVGFYNGSVKLLDVSARTERVIGMSAKDSPSFEPIWEIIWYRGSDYFKNEEQIITTCQDGRISYYRMQDTTELIYSQIMRIARPEGKLKGIETLRRCHVPGIPISRYAAALVIQQHPANFNLYYVGTGEGTIHKCSRNYYHQHLDLFLAHDGPVYVMKFSPFCKKIFLTCGDDWHVRIWVDGIPEPLFELTKMMQSVQGADWSPTHSTIIANICGSDIYIWDLQRKTYYPQSITSNPTNSRFTIVQFTKSGRCLVVGDIEGNVRIYALEDMPFPAFFQDDLLATSIFRGLITRPDLVKQLKKIGKFNYQN